MSMPNELDVCIVTLKPLSQDFVEHLSARLPVHCLKTSDIRGRGKARQDLIRRVDTEWFAFIDDDVWLRPNFWSGVRRLAAHPGVGAVEGMWAYTLDRAAGDYGTAMFRLARRLGRPTWTEKIDRGWTGSTIIRTDAVRNVEMGSLHTFEDEYLRRYVESQGYRWLRTENAVSEHRRRYNLKDCVECGMLSYWSRQTGLLTQVKRFALTPFKVGYALAATGNIGIIPLILNKDGKVLAGVMKGRLIPDYGGYREMFDGLNGNLKPRRRTTGDLAVCCLHTLTPQKFRDTSPSHMVFYSGLFWAIFPV